MHHGLQLTVCDDGVSVAQAASNAATTEMTRPVQRALAESDDHFDRIGRIISAREAGAATARAKQRRGRRRTRTLTSGNAVAFPAAMTTATAPPDVHTHFFTVDVEEYFQVNAFETVAPRATWSSYPRRLDRTMPIILAQLERAGVRGTFFCLGWVAREAPGVIRDIANAGHEIASHGFWHRRVTTLTPDSFREDLRSSRQALEDVAGAPVIGFRAPSFSIVPGTEWAFDVLIEEGFRYDSSLFPIKRRGYGYWGAPRVPHVIRREGGTLAEFPLATTSILGFPLPAAGGGYLRQFPFGFIRRAFAEASASGVSATFYIHPWELDPDQPRLDVPLLTRVRHYRGLAATEGRIARLLREFRFDAIASRLDSVLAAGAEPAG
jgi:polysaccharide deacetylase family protein (PEP-CTERM system associated)